MWILPHLYSPWKHLWTGYQYSKESRMQNLVHRKRTIWDTKKEVFGMYVASVKTLLLSDLIPALSLVKVIMGRVHSIFHLVRLLLVTVLLL